MKLQSSTATSMDMQQVFVDEKKFRWEMNQVRMLFCHAPPSSSLLSMLHRQLQLLRSLSLPPLTACCALQDAMATEKLAEGVSKFAAGTAACSPSLVNPDSL